MLAVVNSIRLQLMCLLGAVALFWMWVGTSSSGVAETSIFFSNIVTVLSITTGFVASFYFFLGARAAPFVERISKTRTFSDLLSATRAYLFVSVFSIGAVFVIGPFSPRSCFSLQDCQISSAVSIVAIWDIVAELLMFLLFYLTSLAVFGFARCVYFFQTMVRGR